MTDQHDAQCPVMEIGCHSVGGYSVHHNRGRAGDCRCGKKCECALIVRVRAAEQVRVLDEMPDWLIEKVHERLRERMEALLTEVSRERDSAPKTDMRADPYIYGQYMWFGGRVTGVVEALALVDGEPDERR
jgi:hypothetical protein